MSTTAVAKNELEEFRISTFEVLGFSKEDSEKLSNVKVPLEVKTKSGLRTYDEPLSWHKVKKMLDAGCTTELALKILL